MSGSPRKGGFNFQKRHREAEVSWGVVVRVGGAGSGSALLTVPTVLAQELLRDGGGAREGRQRSEMPKVTHGAPAPPRETEPGSQARAEGRGQPKHLSTCCAGGRAGLGLRQPGFSCCFFVYTTLAWAK